MYNVLFSKFSKDRQKNSRYVLHCRNGKRKESYKITNTFKRVSHVKI